MSDNDTINFTHYSQKNYLFIYYVVEMEYYKFYNIITNVSQFKKINNK